MLVRRLLLFGLLIASCLAHGQVPNFDFDSARWVVYTTLPYQSVTVYTTRYDTIIGSKTYTTIWSDFYDISSSDTDNLELLIRPDTNNRIWYRYSSIVSTDTNEYVLYDFSLQVGDTFVSQGALNLAIDTFTVFQLYATQLNDSSIVSGYDFNEPFSQSCFGLQQMEMVGSTTHPFYPLLGISTAFDTCLPTVACYQSNGVCLYGAMGLCDPVASITEEFIEGPILYPNPATDQITIVLNEFLSSAACQIRIYNLCGELVKAQSITTNTGTIMIERSGLESGIYLMNISDQQGRTSRIKFAFL